MTVAEAAEQILESVGGSLHVRQITEEIAKRGLYEFKAKDPVAVVSHAMKKDTDRFQNVASGTYTLRSFK